MGIVSRDVFHVKGGISVYLYKASISIYFKITEQCLIWKKR